MGNLFKSLGDTKRNLRELTLLRKLNHKNIAKLIDVVIEVNYLLSLLLFLGGFIDIYYFIFSDRIFSFRFEKIVKITNLPY